MLVRLELVVVLPSPPELRVTGTAAIYFLVAALPQAVAVALFISRLVAVQAVMVEFSGCRAARAMRSQQPAVSLPLLVAKERRLAVDRSPFALATAGSPDQVAALYSHLALQVTGTVAIYSWAAVLPQVAGPELFISLQAVVPVERVVCWC
jgi:hypothetical protein